MASPIYGKLKTPSGVGSQASAAQRVSAVSWHALKFWPFWASYSLDGPRSCAPWVTLARALSPARPGTPPQAPLTPTCAPPLRRTLPLVLSHCVHTSRAPFLSPPWQPGTLAPSSPSSSHPPCTPTLVHCPLSHAITLLPSLPPMPCLSPSPCHLSSPCSPSPCRSPSSCLPASRPCPASHPSTLARLPSLPPLALSLMLTVPPVVFPHSPLAHLPFRAHSLSCAPLTCSLTSPPSSLGGEEQGWGVRGGEGGGGGKTWM